MSIPELRRRNYPEHMIIGTLSGAGTLGLLIPPSIAMIVFGVTVNESISKLFMAALIPGLALAACMMLYVASWSYLNRATFQPMQETDVANIGRRLLDLLPVLVLIMSVIGSIYAGIATATEAAALGVFGAILLSALQRTLTIASLMESIMGAVRTTAMIMLILMGAGFLSLAMGFTGIPRALAAGIDAWNLSPLMLIVILTIFYIILGCFLDGLSSIVLTMAIIEPMVVQAGFDMLWFGVYVMIVVEMAQITPPIGFNLFVLQGMTGRDIGFISKASFPMFCVMGVFIMILYMFPQMALWLPEVLSSR
jgi:tripartite ATP-independent transporter DctM subunit